MRIVQDPQLQIGQLDIAGIKLDLKSRDDIPHILLGLQHIYVNELLRKEVFEILEQVKPTRSGKELSEEQRGQAVDSNKGRPGMEQWTILVLGVLRLGLNTDYDRIHELANQHQTIRQMLGHGDWCDDKTYNLQTLKDNLRLFTPEILDQINQAVVKAGHALIKKNPNGGPITANEEEKLYARCDSFVLETNVHFPTDLNLLYDAVRKAIEESHDLAEAYGLPGWRQYRYNVRVFKRQYRIVQTLRRSTAADEKKKEAREIELEGAYLTYLDLALDYLEKSEQTLQQVVEKKALLVDTTQLIEYQNYIKILQDQIFRRTILKEKIPHDEKIFSIFEPHTEWISKGKAGVPVELGLRVAIVEDQYRFILHHQVMEKQTDDKIAVSIVEQTLERFPTLGSMSFDKGFHSVENQKELASLLEQVILPKKGRLNKTDQARESSPEFKRHRQQHSAVESAINALEHNGLDVCPDHGIKGFKRYVSLAIVSRNIKRLGAVIRQQEVEKEERRRGPYKNAA